MAMVVCVCEGCGGLLSSLRVSRRSRQTGLGDDVSGLSSKREEREKVRQQRELANLDGICTGCREIWVSRRFGRRSVGVLVFWFGLSWVEEGRVVWFLVRKSGATGPFLAAKWMTADSLRISFVNSLWPFTPKHPAHKKSNLSESRPPSHFWTTHFTLSNFHDRPVIHFSFHIHHDVSISPARWGRPKASLSLFKCENTINLYTWKLLRFRWRILAGS